MAAHPGGAPANFLAPLAKYGKKTALLACVGDDAFGHLLCNTVRDIGISTTGVSVTREAFTTMAFVTLDSNGEREFSFARKPGADTLLKADTDSYSLVDQTAVIHFGTVGMTNEPSRASHRMLVEYAKKAGKLVSFDPNLREPLWGDLAEAKKQMLWGIAQTDVLKISDTEAKLLYGLDPEKSAKEILANNPVQLVFVTCGKDGCYFSNRTVSGYVPSLQNICVTDTTGAGDIFGGSAMYGILNSGKSPKDLCEVELFNIVRFACTTAALSTTKLGGISSVPELSEVQRSCVIQTDI